MSGTPNALRAASSDTLAMDDDITSRGGLALSLRLIALSVINLFVLLLWLGILAWLIGHVLTDRFSWSQWLWWIPTPAVLAACSLGFILSFRAAKSRQRRRRRMVLWFACSLVLLMYFTTIEHHLLQTAPAAPAKALTVAHWNMTLDNNADLPALLRSIAALDADVIAVTTPPNEIRRMVREHAEASDGAMHTFDGWPVMLISRIPIIRTRILVATDRTYVTQVELDAEQSLGRSLSLYLVDLPSAPRLARMRIARTTRALLDAADPPPPDLVIGDFNITRNSTSINTLFPGMTYAYASGGHGYGASFHRRFPLYHIDHILVDEAAGLRAVRYDLIDEGQSRHWAQKAWIVAR